MLNIILIEDEPPILRGLQGHIRKFSENFTVKGAFANAQAALSFLEENGEVVDVAITDIELPVINGLSFIEQIKGKYPHITCIILSGYDNFNYAREGIRLGVSNYLLKPVDIVELHKTLLTIYENKCIELMTQPFAAEPERAVSEFQQDYFLAVLCSGNDSYFSSVPHSEAYAYEDHSGDLSGLLKPVRGMRFRTAPGKTWFESIVFLNMEPKDGETEEERIFNFFKPLLRQQAHFTIVYSKVPTSLSEVGGYLQKIRYCLYKSVVIGKSRIIRYEPGGWREPEFDPSAFQEELYHLERIFAEANLPLFKQELHRFLMTMQGREYNQVTVFYYLNLLASGCLVRQPKDRPNILIPELVNDAIFYSPDYEALFENLLSVFLDYLSADSQNKGTIAEKIDLYIRQHYMEPINTARLAEEFNFTPSYLSKIFREYKNIPPIEYIIRLKMDKAKELLVKNPSLPVKDCAALVGYGDPLYFSKVFKKVTGLSPKQFTRSHAEQGEK